MSSLKESSQADNINNPSYVSSQQNSSEDSAQSFYFQSYPIKNMSNFLVSSFYSEKILAGMDILIHLGAVEVNKKRKTIDELMDKIQLKEQQRLAIQAKEKKQFIQKQLQLLNKQIEPGESEIVQDPNQNGLVLSKEQHKAIADKFKRQFMKRSKRHQQLVQQMIQRIKEEQQAHRKDIQQKQKIELQLRRQSIDSKLQQNKRKKQQMRIFQQKSNERIKQIYKNKAIYDRLQLRYRKQVVLPLIEQKQKKLKQINQQKSLNFEQIKQHQKQYLQKKALHQSRRTVFREQWTYVPPPRSERLTVIMEMQALEKIKKSQQKKAKIQQNLARHAQYASYLRRNFIPKIDVKKKQEIQQRLQKQKPARAESVDSRVIGMTYLQQAKRKRKKIIRIQNESQDINNNLTNEQNAQKSQIQQKGKTLSINQAKANKVDKYYHSKRENIKKVINNSQLNNPQKIKYLSLQTDKLDANIKRKQAELLYRKDEKLKQQALQLLLSSIEAKIGIIETYG